MDSINKNQQEDNHKNVFGDEAVAKIKLLAKKASSCFFCTAITTGAPFQTRPMAAEVIDDDGNFWFLSPSDSYKNKELEQDPHVQMLFQGSAHSDFMTLYGRVEISRDPQKIKDLWDPMMKNWFTEGIDDPRITVLKVIPTDGYYWDTKHGQAIAFVKSMIGSAIGKTMDDSIEGKITV